MQLLLTLKTTEKIENLFVFTNDKSVQNISDSIGVISHSIQVIPENEKSELLPYGTYTSVDYLEQGIDLNFEDIMILGFRNPLVTSGLIDNAIKEYNISNMTSLMSIKKSTDHPVQLNAYYQILDAGFIYLFDEDQEPENFIGVNNTNSNYRITRPFYFDWVAKGIQRKSKTGLYCRVCDGPRTKYIPVGKEVTKTISFPLWIWDSSYSARMVICFSDKIISPESSDMKTKYELIGLSINDDSTGIPAFLYKNSNSAENIILFGGKTVSSTSLRVKYKPVSFSNKLKASMKEIEIPDAATPIYLTDMGDFNCGIVYVILGIAHNSSYDICESFPHNDQLWTNGSQKTNLKTGRKISGRQDFPEVFEPDSTLFITQKHLVTIFEKEILSGNVGGFDMGGSGSIQIKSTFDLLKYDALKRFKVESVSET